MRAEPQRSSANTERDIFLHALEIPDTRRRAEYLKSECGTDSGLLARIEALLTEEPGVGKFLETPAINRSDTTDLVPAANAVGASITEKPGDRIGKYKLLQKIGEGGSGVVYMADQEEPVRRRVALKIIKLGMDTRNVIARFEAERQALAMMDHPNIARVLDAGATETGRPFFVMELVRGIKITDYCDQNNLPTRDRLGLFVQVCQAIQHAHQKGVIHRDIKPSNILVTLHDGIPVPKVIDFGIAKATEHRLTEKTLFTEFTMFIGTPAYMSPEQAELSGLDIDTRSDIYALGVLLYELLTGRTPFDAETLLQVSLDECRRTIREQEPSRPSNRLAGLIATELTTTARQRHTEGPKLIYQITGDLDWIAMKCLEKDRTRRYATANDLALDVHRFLNGEPILARPPSNFYRFQKFVRRHRGAFAAGTAIMTILLVGAGLSSWLALRARRAEARAHVAQQEETRLRQQAEAARARAQEKELAARLNEYVADINLAQRSLVDGHLTRALNLLNKHQPQPGETDLRGFEWRYLRQLCQGDEHTALPAFGRPVESLAVSPNGQFLALGGMESCKVFDVRNKTILATIEKGANSLAFLPDSKTLITASRTTTRAWSTETWAEIKPLPDNGGPIALSRDGKFLATNTREGVRVWEVATWTPGPLFTNAFGPVAFCPAGQWLAADTRDGISLWPLAGNAPPVLLANSTNLFAFWLRNFRAMAFSPDGKSFVAARNTLSERGVFTLSFWDTQTGREVAAFPADPEHVEHTAAITALAFSPDGRTLATTSLDRSLRLWDLAAGRCVARLQGHLDEVHTVAFAPDNQSLFTGARDGSVKNWPSRPQKKEDVLPGSWMPLAFSRDGRRLAALSRQNELAFLNLTTREPADTLPMERPRQRFPMLPPASVALSADFKTVAQGLDDGRIRIWKLPSRTTTEFTISERGIASVALSPDGRILLAGDRRQGLTWCDLVHHTNTSLSAQGFRAQFSPDGSTFVIFQRGDAIELWDTATKSMRVTLETQPQPGLEAAFSADGSVLGVVEFDSVRLYDVRSGKLLHTLTGHKQRITSLAFSPDGRTLATTSDDSTLKFWNLSTEMELLSIPRLGGNLRFLLFSPDGEMLIGSSGFMSQTPTAGIRFHHAPSS